MYKTNDFNNKMTISNKMFELVKPALEHYFGGIVCPVECQNNDACRLLDMRGGIDALVSTDTAFFGIAHRVKFNDYTDFTIRMRRDDGKRTEIDHIRQPGIKPRYHVQTVSLGNRPTKIAIAKSMDLLYAIDDGLATVKTTYDGNRFAILDWNILIANGINVDIINL